MGLLVDFDRENHFVGGFPSRELNTEGDPERETGEDWDGEALEGMSRAEGDVN